VSERRTSHALVEALKAKLRGPEIVERFIATFRERAARGQSASSPARRSKRSS
jgi:hypothetical protein